jgi:hypothetical protein
MSIPVDDCGPVIGPSTATFTSAVVEPLDELDELADPLELHAASPSALPTTNEARTP